MLCRRYNFDKYVYNFHKNFFDEVILYDQEMNVLYVVIDKNNIYNYVQY